MTVVLTKEMHCACFTHSSTIHHGTKFSFWSLRNASIGSLYVMSCLKIDLSVRGSNCNPIPIYIYVYTYVYLIMCIYYLSNLCYTFENHAMPIITYIIHIHTYMHVYIHIHYLSNFCYTFENQSINQSTCKTYSASNIILRTPKEKPKRQLS